MSIRSAHAAPEYAITIRDGGTTVAYHPILVAVLTLHSQIYQRYLACQYSIRCWRTSCGRLCTPLLHVAWPDFRPIFACFPIRFGKMLNKVSRIRDDVAVHGVADLLRGDLDNSHCIPIELIESIHRVCHHGTDGSDFLLERESSVYRWSPVVRINWPKLANIGRFLSFS